jgi:DNA-binding IclR family transcriptional regulator
MGYEIRSIKNAIQLLSCFDEHNPELGVNELTTKINLHKSTVHRILITLEKTGILEQDCKRGKYRLGLRLYELGNLALHGFELSRVSQSYLKELMEKTQETVHLVVYDKGEGVYINKVDGPQRMRMVSRIGSRLPLHCTGVGKVLLAYLEQSELKKVIRDQGLCRFTDNTITHAADLEKELEKIRKVGFAIDNEEIELGLKCVAAPVRDHDGKIIASVSISGSSNRITKDKIPYLSRSVIETSEKISYRLGYRIRRKLK